MYKDFFITMFVFYNLNYGVLLVLCPFMIILLILKRIEIDLFLTFINLNLLRLFSEFLNVVAFGSKCLAIQLLVVKSLSRILRL